jgi:gliding motility-associated-like protein
MYYPGMFMKFSLPKLSYAFILVFLFNTSLKAQTWELVGGQLSNWNHSRRVFCLTTDTVNNLLYAGGGFLNLSSTTDTVHNIAVWDGSAWKSVGKGANDSVYAITLYNGGVYVAGKFTTVGGVSANRVANLNGSTFSSLGNGVGNTAKNVVRSMAVYNGELYVAGYFSVADGIPVNNIAKWNGSSWSDVGGGINNAVYALAVSNGKLYAGGVFTKAGGSAMNNIAAWDGSSWSALSSGTNNAVWALEYYGGKLYAAGKFNTAGGTIVNYVGIWDGSTWTSAAGLSSPVCGLKKIGALLYAAGTFSLPSSGVVNWNGSVWSPMESGTDYTARCFENYGGKIHAGGDFDVAGGNYTGPTARWNPLAPHSAFIVSNTSFCHNDCVHFTDQTINSPVSWSWNFPGGTPGTSNIQNPGPICYNTPGVFPVYLTTTNSSGIDLQTTASLMYIHPYIQLTSPYGICKGTVGVNIVAHDGGTYSWTPSTNLSCTNCASPVASPSATQSYTVTVVDSSLCSWTAMTTVVVDTFPIPTVTFSDTAVCKGTRIQVHAGGGSAYAWVPASAFTNASLQNPYFIPPTSRYYIVKVSNSYISPNVTCTSLDSIYIRVKPLPVMNKMSEEHVCPGSSASLLVTGGVSWAWYPSAGLSDTTLDNPVAIPMATTMYYVTATDTNACKSSDSVKVSVGCDLSFYTGFGPGDSGGKDYWFIEGIENNPTNQVSIFNEWGSLVWEGTNYDNALIAWKGANQSGQPLVAGTYYYFVKTAYNKYKGWVELFR